MRKEFTNKQSYGEFLRHVMTSVASMIFLSFYTTIDGFFVSRYVGPMALAAINVVVPLTCIFFGIAVMLASGSGAIVNIKMGQKDTQSASEIFSFVALFLVVVGFIFTILGFVYIRPILTFLGATDKIMPYALPYATVIVFASLVMMFKLYFEYYARIDGSPKVALTMSFIGLVCNVILDFLFIVILKMGILGAALGTALAILISACIGLQYFLSSKSLLKFKLSKCYFKELLNSCANGSSEMLTELSTGFTTFIFNILILQFFGENGIAAMSIIMYVYYFFIATYFGITVGIAPSISYSLGADNKQKIKESLRYCFISIGWMSIVLFLISYGLRDILISLFTTDPQVQIITSDGLKLFSFTFIFIGFNIFMSGYFTAIGNGGISALISILRSLVFVSLFAFILPKIIGVSGVWLAMPLSEICSFFITGACYLLKGRKCHTHHV